MSDELIKDRCHRCGYQFDEVKDENECPSCGLVNLRSELIDEDSDYEWAI